MKRAILISLLLCILISCNDTNKPKSLNEMFNNTKDLIHINVMDPSDYLIGLKGKMLLIDSTLIVLDYLTDSFFHVFNINNNKYIGNYGSKGQGPQDFLHPASLLSSTSNEFLSYDSDANSLKGIRLDSLIQGIISYRNLISSVSFSNFLVFPTKHNTYIASGMYESNMFSIIDMDNNELGRFMDYPLENEDIAKIDSRNIALAYQGAVNISPDKTKMVYASLFGTILGIYDINETSISERYLMIYDYPQFVEYNQGGGFGSPITKEGISAFLDINVTDNYIYSLYAGKNIAEFSAQAFEAQDIYVFDWNGKPIMNYRLDIPVSNIVVSNDHKTIYAIAKNPEPTLVKFDINL